jgi:hypothetical protein
MNTTDEEGQGANGWNQVVSDEGMEAQARRGYQELRDLIQLGLSEGDAAKSW